MIAPGMRGGSRVDLTNECVWRGETAFRLTPEAFAVLPYLAQYWDRLVTRDELLQSVWAGITVSDGPPATCIGELRQALGDEPQSPRFIQTVHRRG